MGKRKGRSAKFMSAIRRLRGKGKRKRYSSKRRGKKSMKNSIINHLLHKY